MIAVITFHWDTFVQYLWPLTALENPLIARGLVVTLFMAVMAQVLGCLIGLPAALALLSKKALLRSISTVYVTYFRGTPVLVQLALIYFGMSALGLYRFPDIAVAGIVLPGVVQAGIVGLGLNEGAFMAEIIRAGIISIDVGQTEAAKAVGMTQRQLMRWIVLPQAARVILPPLGNEFNGMLKATTLVVTIGGVELFNAYEQINGVIFEPFELFLAVSFYYLAFTIAWSIVQGRLERGLSQHVATTAPRRGLLSRWLDRKGV